MAKNKRTPKINVGEFPYADIMPPTRRNAIDLAIAKSKWLKIISVGAVVAIVLSLGAFGYKLVQQLNYDNAVADQAAVEVSIATHAKVDSALTLKDVLSKNILRASATSISWQDLQQRINSNLPSDSTLTSFEVTTGGVEAGKPSIAVLVNVSSSQPIAYSNVLESFGRINGLIDGSLLIGNMFAQGSEENGDQVYVYPVAFSIDDSILARIFSYLDPKVIAEAKEAAKKAEAEEAAKPKQEAPAEAPVEVTEEILVEDETSVEMREPDAEPAAPASLGLFGLTAKVQQFARSIN